MIRTMSLALLVALAGAGGAAAQGIERLDALPPEGLVLSGAQRLQPARIGGRFRIVPVPPSASVTPWEDLQDKPPRNVWRLDRQRRHERDKELNQRQGGSLLRGVLTEVLYKRQRKKAEGR